MAIFLAVSLGRAAARGDAELVTARVMNGPPATEPELEPAAERRLRAA
ncbi:hypothetical protein [Baekduia soli]|nr:hypothetical protein [Baekduia soli]